MKKVYLFFSLLFVVKVIFASPVSFQEKLKFLEISSNGKIGVYALNTANGAQLQYNADERFSTGCTSKVLGVAAILNLSVQDKTLLTQKITYSQKDLTNWSPITEKHLDSGMIVKELCAAAISYSDNTAMNLLVKKMGGLANMNSFAHKLGNSSFRQDNIWPEEAFSGGPGNVQDSSTPKDMAISLQKLVFTKVLAKSQQELLVSWLKATVTGVKRIKAGVPENWVVAHKTGTNAIYGITNDLGIIWPSKCAPIVLAIYYTNNDKKALPREDIIAAVTRAVVDNFSENDECIKDSLKMI